MRSVITNAFMSARDTISLLSGQASVFEGLEKSAAMCVHTLSEGGKIMLCGNGGSAADAQHIAAELVGRFSKARPGLAAISLTTDTSALTAIGNDFGFEHIFSRQVEALAASNDVLIGISTSGNSENVINAMRAAKAAGAKVIGFTGEKVGKMDSLCDALIKIPSYATPRIQEAHILCGHTLCELIETISFGGIHG